MTELHDTPVIEPVVEAVTEPAAPVELPEQTYNYQPTDEHNRPLGGKQVIKYRTPDELTQKLTEQNVLLVRRLREETKKNRLGISDPDEVPADAQRFDSPTDFTPRELSADERVRLSRDLLNPDKFEEATDALFEAKIGANPLKLRKTLTQLQASNMHLIARAESESFIRATKEYYPCKDNFETITNWMLKKDLAPVFDNFNLAFKTLSAAGLLLEAPNVREEVPPSAPKVETITEPTSANTQPAQEESSRITQTEPAQQERPVATIPTGLSRSQTSDQGAPPAAKYTLAQINAMSGDEYKRRLLGEKGFAEIVEKLETEAARRS